MIYSLMQNLTPLFSDNSNNLLNSLFSYIPPLEGKCYSTYIYVKENNQYLVKILKRKNTLREDSYRNVFERHKKEQKIVEEVFEGTSFILPTLYFEFNNDGVIEYANIQPFISNSLGQYKLISRGKSEIDIPVGVLKGIISVKDLFLERLRLLLELIKPNLVDIDFFIIDHYPWILIFDSTEFWPEKREGKDRMQIDTELETFFNRIVRKLSELG